MSTKPNKFIAKNKKQIQEIIAKHAAPDLLITYTPTQNFQSRPDVCAAMFHKEFTEVTKLIGTAPKVEFKIRGVPSMHILPFSTDLMKIC